MIHSQWLKVKRNTRNVFFFFMKSYVTGTPQKYPIEALLMSTHTIFSNISGAQVIVSVYQACLLLTTPMKHEKHLKCVLC